MARHAESIEGDAVPRSAEKTYGQDQFVPALGFARLTPLYDALLAMATRERVWRTALVKKVAPAAGETIVDVGCGTGTLAILLKNRAPAARVIGIDPDPEVLAIAGRKAVQAGVKVEWHRGYARDAAKVLGTSRADKAVSSLVFHQVPPAEKRAGVLAMFDAVRPGGEIHIADYARQTGVSRLLFTIIGLLDGFGNTRPNADGALEKLLHEATKTKVEPFFSVATLTGAIRLFACTRPMLAGAPR